MNEKHKWDLKVMSDWVNDMYQMHEKYGVHEWIENNKDNTVELYYFFAPKRVFKYNFIFFLPIFSIKRRICNL